MQSRLFTIPSSWGADAPGRAGSEMACAACLHGAQRVLFRLACHSAWREGQSREELTLVGLRAWVTSGLHSVFVFKNLSQDLKTGNFHRLNMDFCLLLNNWKTQKPGS